MLVFFLGFEIFGLPLVLGDPEGHLVLATYLYKLTNKLGTPSYHLMAAVAVCIVAVDVPAGDAAALPAAERRQVRHGQGQGRPRSGRCRSASWRWVAAAILVAVAVRHRRRAAVGHRAARVRQQLGRRRQHLAEVLTLDNFREVFDQPTLVRGIVNTVLIGVVGGALAVACYTAIGLATHRKHDGWSRFVDYLVLVPRAVPGLLAGLAFLWVFLFFPPLAPLRTTIFSVWLAYTVVWLAYGMRLDLGVAAAGRPRARGGRRAPSARRAAASARDITLPLIRYGLLGSWLLVFMIFEREYSTGVYLLAPGHRGDRLAARVAVGHGRRIDMVAALSLINIVLVGGRPRRGPALRRAASHD